MLIYTEKAEFGGTFILPDPSREFASDIMPDVVGPSFQNASSGHDMEAVTCGMLQGVQDDHMLRQHV